MSFLEVLNKRFNPFFGDKEDLDILDNIKIKEIQLCQSKQR